MTMTGTNSCVHCEREFTQDNPCWNDTATHADGSHDDGVCASCCGPSAPYRPYPSYERMDCDQ